MAWADQHPAESLEAAEVFRASGYAGGFGDTAIPLAGPGAPLVAEFSVAEFAAAVGMTTDAGKYYLGQAVELQIPAPPAVERVVVQGQLPGWKARRVARRDHQPRPHRPRPRRTWTGTWRRWRTRSALAAVDRLVTEAIARHMPETAEETRRRAADGRHFTVDHDQVSFAGTSLIHGELDLADALDLDHAVTAHADHLKDLGCTESLDVRRSLAIGELARRQLALDLTTDHTDPADSPVVEEGALAPVSKPRNQPRRPVTLYLHLHQSAIEGTGGVSGGIGRVENTRSPVTVEQIRTWCGHPDAQVTVKPVIDLADHVHVEAYEVPDRIAEPVALRDVTCVFPWCTRPARRLRPDQHGCDCDHVVPHTRGGATCTCQLAPLCRRHHRLKTHGGWTYTTLEPGSYLWSSPHRYQYLRDHEGTLDVTRDRHSPAPPPDQ